MSHHINKTQRANALVGGDGTKSHPFVYDLFRVSLIQIPITAPEATMRLELIMFFFPVSRYQRRRLSLPPEPNLMLQKGESTKISEESVGGRE